MPQNVIENGRLIVGASENQCLKIHDLMALIKPTDIIYKGATGILILDVLLGNIDAYVRLINRTKKWDICVGEAFLSAFGGRVVDKFGRPYQYNPAAESFENDLGVIASLNPSVLAQICDTISSSQITR